MYQYFIPFYSWITFHHMNILHFIYQFISWWTFGPFPLLTIMDNLHKFLYRYMLSVLLGVELGVEVLGYMVTKLPDWLPKWLNHSLHQNYMRILIFPHHKGYFNRWHHKCQSEACEVTVSLNLLAINSNNFQLLRFDWFNLKNIVFKIDV